MYKTSVTYENFEGEQITEDLYFNLTKAEITKLQLSEQGGFDKKMESILKSQDNSQIIELFEKLILMSYGKRTAEGAFIKSKDLSAAFATTEAYSELFMSLLSDESKQKAFFLGIMPKDLANAAAKEMETKQLTLAQ